jgi:hypothetical protein
LLEAEVVEPVILAVEVVAVEVPEDIYMVPIFPSIPD